MNRLMQGIKSKIILIIILVVGGGFTAFELYDYSSSKADAMQELHELTTITTDRLAEGLTLPLWEVDVDWVGREILSEMLDRRVYAVFVYADDQLFAGKVRGEAWQAVDSADNISGDYVDASREVERNGKKIGAVKVYVSKQFMLDELKRDLLWEGMTLALLALLVVIVLVGLLDDLVVRRLKHILSATEAIASGDYSQPLHVTRQDEVGMLADGINRMKEGIQQREEDLKASESRFRSLIENAADGIFIADLSGRYIDVNSAGCSMLGFERDEIIGKTIMDLIPPEEVQRLDDSKDEMQKGDTNLSEWSLIKKDGSYLPVEVSANILPSGQWQAFVRDISERKQIEEKIRKLSQAIEQSGEAIAITDADGTIEYVNPAFCAVTGYSEQEVLGGNPRILKSGSQDVRFYEKMWHTIADGQIWQAKVINKKKSGELYPAMLTISPIKNEQGEITNFIGLQQNLEKYEELEAQFHQSQKMEAIGTLVGGIAHDFNNNLAGITGNLYLAKKAARDMPDVVKRLDSVEKLSFTAAATIQQLLAFSRKGIVEMHPLSISSFLKETIKLNQVSLPENISFQLQVNDTDMQVKGDINQLQQVLMNLINNAYDAVRECEAPSIQVQLDRFKADESFTRQHEEAHEGEYACISITDNGTGIKAEHIEHIFEPFFTTKEPGKGTGLGLAMVYGAVKTHGGLVHVESSQDENRGTVVQVYLPLLAAGESVNLTAGNDEVVDGHGETILLVDDNETVLETGRDVLEGMGYKVLTAEDGLQAIEIYRSHMAEIDLIILDVVMPNLGGVEALKAIRDFNPDVKAIFATGYDKLSTLSADKHKITEKVISKPFTISILSQAIRQVLDKA